MFFYPNILKTIVFYSYNKLKTFIFILNPISIIALLYCLKQFPVILAESIIVGGITDNNLKKDVNDYITHISPEKKVNLIRLKNNLQKILRSNGYYNPSLLFKRFNDEYIVTIDEKDPIIVRNIKITFNVEDVKSKQLLEEFLEKYNIKYLENSILTHKKYEELKKYLISYFKYSGYLDAKYVKSNLIVDTENLAADFILEINPGTYFTINKVNYHFNSNLKEEWLAEIELFQRGCAFTEEVKIKLYESLMSSGFFKNVCISPSNNGEYGKEIDCFCIASNEKKIAPSVAINKKSVSFKLKFTWTNIGNLGHSIFSELITHYYFDELSDHFKLNKFRINNLFKISKFYTSYKIPRISILKSPVSCIMYISLENKNNDVCILNYLNVDETEAAFKKLTKKQKCIGLEVGFPYLSKKHTIYYNLHFKVEKPDYKLGIGWPRDKGYIYFLCFFNLRKGLALNNKNLLNIGGGAYGKDFSIKGFFWKLLADLNLLKAQIRRFLICATANIEVWDYLFQPPSIKYGCLETENRLMIGYEDYLVTSIKYIQEDDCIITAKKRLTISSHIDYLIFSNLKALVFCDLTILNTNLSFINNYDKAASIGIGSKYEYSFLCVSCFLFYKIPLKIHYARKIIPFIDNNLWFLPSFSINIHI